MVYQQGIYLASPLTIVLHTQLDISTEAIVMKVTPRKEMKKVSLQKVQAEGLHFIQPLLHYAPVDDLHHSQSTMQRGLCSSQLDHMNEETWSQAIGTLSKSYPKLMTASWDATYIEEGQVRVWMRLCLHLSMFVGFFCQQYQQNVFYHTALNYL